MIKVSIIVPIYNAGYRLRECLETLVNQTLREIEIICVLDCPTDGSEKIAEEYAAKDNRIKLIYNKTNLHVAESRNRGMNAANGQYIGFSDHDDKRRLDMYELLYMTAKINNSDIVFSNSIVRKNEIDTTFEYNSPSKHGIISSLIIGDIPQNKNFLSSTVWASIYQKKMLVDNNLYFMDRMQYLEEDRIFNLSVFLCANDVNYVDQSFYIWNKQENSLSEQWVTDEGSARLAFFEYIYQLLEKSNVFQIYRKEWILAFQYTLHKYYPYFAQLRGGEKEKLVDLIKVTRYPILGKYENLKLISKKRFKLYQFIFKLYFFKNQFQ